MYVYLTKLKKNMFKLDLMLIQCVIESHAEVWTCQFAMGLSAVCDCGIS